MGSSNSCSGAPSCVNLSWRMTKEGDLPQCLALHPAGIGHEFVGHERAALAWSALLRMPATAAVTVESNQPIGASHIVAFAASAFISQSFAESELSEPKPGLVARIISSIDARRPVILTESELRRANTYNGVHLVVLISRWSHLLTEEQAEEAKMHLAASFLELHAGYRLL